MAFKTLNVQYASDLHLEHLHKVNFKQILNPSAPVLVLAGDLGNPQKALYTQLIEYCESNWDHVIIVPGNHELYNAEPKDSWKKSISIQSAEKQLNLCRNICNKFTNVHFLHRESFNLPNHNIRVLGTTLWSHIPETKMAEANYEIGDYRYIAKEHSEGGRPESITPYDTVKWHSKDVTWLSNEIEEAEREKKNCLVVTHHLPTNRLIADRWLNHSLNCCYSTDLNHLLRAPVRGWIAGHTHNSKQYTLQYDDPPTVFGAVQLGVNALGYSGEHDLNYSNSRVMTIPSGDATDSPDRRDRALLRAAELHTEMEFI